MAPGARSKFVAPTLKPEVFRKEMHCTPEGCLLVLLSGLFSDPRSHSGPT